MHRLRFVGVIALTLMALFTVSAATASAAGKKLLLKSEEGEVLKPGSSVASVVHFSDGECALAEQFELATNSAATDKLKNGEQIQTFCETTGYAVSGAIKEVSLSATGYQTYKLSTKIAFTIPGPCEYDFSKFAGGFDTPFDDGALSAIYATGKLNKNISSSGCATKLTTPVKLFGAYDTVGEVT